MQRQNYANHAGNAGAPSPNIRREFAYVTRRRHPYQMTADNESARCQSHHNGIKGILQFFVSGILGNYVHRQADNREHNARGQDIRLY